MADFSKVEQRLTRLNYYSIVSTVDLSDRSFRTHSESRVKTKQVLQSAIIIIYWLRINFKMEFQSSSFIQILPYNVEK